MLHVCCTFAIVQTIFFYILVQHVGITIHAIVYVFLSKHYRESVRRGFGSRLWTMIFSIWYIHVCDCTSIYFGIIQEIIPSTLLVGFGEGIRSSWFQVLLVWWTSVSGVQNQDEVSIKLFLLELNFSTQQLQPLI